jgi:PIN domain nuclease of toxin-antitoxin system
LLRFDIPICEIDIFLDATFPPVIPFDRLQAAMAAQFQHEYRVHRLLCDDCSSLALVKIQGLPVLTDNAQWAEIPLGVEVKSIW